jgi:hypothetical protein
MLTSYHAFAKSQLPIDVTFSTPTGDCANYHMSATATGSPWSCLSLVFPTVNQPPEQVKPTPDQHHNIGDRDGGFDRSDDTCLPGYVGALNTAL